MNNMTNFSVFIENLIKLLENYNQEKEKQGFIPTIQLLIDELKEHNEKIPPTNV